MQVQMQAFSRRSQSLRSSVVKHLRRRTKGTLWVQEAKNPSRKNGWAKIKSTECVGAINIEWDASQHMLVARAIAEKGNNPMPLLGDFISYLLEHHGKRISALNVQLRK